MDKLCGIYKIISPSNRIYIGSAVDINRRWKNYFRIHGAKGQPRLKNSFNKYGVKNHIFEVVEECIIEELYRKERHWQEFYDVLSKKGLNCEYVSTNEKPRFFPEERKQKQRDIIKGNTFRRRAVLKYSIDGIFIKEYESAQLAAFENDILKTSICNNLKGNSKTCGGYIWKYKETVFKIQHEKILLKYDLEMNLLDTFVSVYAAGKKGNSCAAIYRYLKGGVKNPENFIWKIKINAL